VAVLVAPLVFQAPDGPAARVISSRRVCFVGPGRCVCLWAAARPRAIRAASLRLGASSRIPARPRRRPPAPRPGPPVPPVPSTPAPPGPHQCRTSFPCNCFRI